MKEPFVFCVSQSFSKTFGKNSSWLVFLEEDTNVKVGELLGVLAKFDGTKVSSLCPPAVRRSLPPRPPLVWISPCLNSRDQY